MTMNFRRRYITDFGRIEGIPGVYMANQLSSKMLTDPSAMRGLDYEKFIQTKVCALHICKKQPLGCSDGAVSPFTSNSSSAYLP